MEEQYNLSKNTVLMLKELTHLMVFIGHPDTVGWHGIVTPMLKFAKSDGNQVLCFSKFSESMENIHV